MCWLQDPNFSDKFRVIVFVNEKTCYSATTIKGVNCACYSYIAQSSRVAFFMESPFTLKRTPALTLVAEGVCFLVEVTDIRDAGITDAGCDM